MDLVGSITDRTDGRC